MKKNFKKILLLTSMLFSLTFAAMAQPEFEDDVDDVPLDGGISLLVGAGLAFGAKKVYENNKKQND